MERVHPKSTHTVRYIGYPFLERTPPDHRNVYEGLRGRNIQNNRLRTTYGMLIVLIGASISVQILVIPLNPVLAHFLFRHFTRCRISIRSFSYSQRQSTNTAHTETANDGVASVPPPAGRGGGRVGPARAATALRGECAAAAAELSHVLTRDQSRPLLGWIPALRH